MPTFALAGSQGSRIVAVAHEEAGAARMPRLAFEFLVAWFVLLGLWGVMIVEMRGANKVGMVLRGEDCAV